MLHRKSLLIALFFLLIFAAASCIPSGEDGLSFAEIDLTYAVETVVFQLSQTVSVAPAETQAPLVTPTLALVPWVAASSTPVTLVSSVPTSTGTQPACEAAVFVMDVTVPSGTSFYAESEFTKIWRLRNVGTCVWSRDYALVFVEGDQLSTTNAVTLPGDVLPFQEVDIAVPMRAPKELGRYRGGWLLRNPSGRQIRLQGEPVYIDIEVINPLASRLIYHFSDHVCEADWSSSASGINTLACPGERDDLSGYVFSWDNPLVEGNRETDHPVIEMHPPWQTHPLWNLDQQGGWIKGKFPPVVIQPGSHFRAQAGCLQGADTCDVSFSLLVQIPSLSWQELGTWEQAYDGRLESIDIDLVNYSGLQAGFQFYVDANSNGGLDQAVWINPRIEN